MNFLIQQGGGGGVVGKSDFKENPKSDLDLDLGFVNFLKVYWKLIVLNVISCYGLSFTDVWYQELISTGLVCS